MTVVDVEKLAMELSALERGKLAEKLIASLPRPFIEDDDDGVEEALRRSREMDENPDLAISFEDLDEMVRKRFPQCVSE
jgi:putative addiction module component (TIGR02574 family)